MPWPTQILSAISLVKQLGPIKLRYWQPIRPGVAAQHLRAAVRDLEWLEEQGAMLRSALT